MNMNGIAAVQIKIGKITFLAQPNADQIYYKINLDVKEGWRSETKIVKIFYSLINLFYI